MFACLRRRRSGLTILELLVCVTVLTLLAALVLPALLHARSAARGTACRSNLRQWALAANLYADIHNGRLPYRGQGIQPTTMLNRSDDWFNALPPLMESSPYSSLVALSHLPQAGQWSAWICPEAEHRDANEDESAFFAYGMNMALSTPYNGRPDHIEKVGPKQSMVFMADGLGPYCSVMPAPAPYSPLARHSGTTVHLAFLDGRVEAYAGQEVGCGVGDPERPDIRWQPPGSRWPGPPK